jgi:hypothetical protein
MPVGVNSVSNINEYQVYFVGCMLCFLTTHCSLMLIVRSELVVPTFATRRLHACHHAKAHSGGR